MESLIKSTLSGLPVADDPHDQESARWFLLLLLYTVLESCCHWCHLTTQSSFFYHDIRAGKDAMIKEFEATVTVNGPAVENLKSKLEELHLESRLKEDELEDLRTVKKNLETEKSDLISKNTKFAKRLDTSLQEIKDLNEFVNEIVVTFTDLDSQSLVFAKKIIQLNALFDSDFEMIREKGEFAARHAQQKFGKLQDQYTSITSEKNDLQLANNDLKNKVAALQEEQEHAMVQHSEESLLAENQIRKLESEVELLLSKKMEMELQISKLKENIVTLSDNSKLSENEMVNSSHKICTPSSNV